MSRPGDFEERLADVLSPIDPPAGGQVVRQAQVVHTLTEATSRVAPARGWMDDADPNRHRQAATAVVVSRAAVFVVAYGFAVAVMLAVLVRVLEWLS